MCAPDRQACEAFALPVSLKIIAGFWAEDYYDLAYVLKG